MQFYGILLVYNVSLMGDKAKRRVFVPNRKVWKLKELAINKIFLSSIEKMDRERSSVEGEVEEL